MSRAMADTPKRRARRQVTEECKASAVRLVLDEGKNVSAAARDLDLTETALRERYCLSTQINVPVSATRSRGLTSSECEWQITWMSKNPLEENDDRPCTSGARFQRGQGIHARGSSRREVRCTYHGRN
jgi:hypothetical protein